MTRIEGSSHSYGFSQSSLPIASWRQELDGIKDLLANNMGSRAIESLEKLIASMKHYQYQNPFLDKAIQILGDGLGLLQAGGKDNMPNVDAYVSYEVGVANGLLIAADR